MIYSCCDEHRRTAVAAHGVLNGIDYLEVLDTEAPDGSPRQRTLLIRLLKAVPDTLDRLNVRIAGTGRAQNVAVEWAAGATEPLPNATTAEKQFLASLPEPENVFVVRTDRSGDFSTYTFRLVQSQQSDHPPAEFDADLSEVEFWFKIECPSDFDCRPQIACPREPEAPVELDYLAKDYPSFRRLVLDRLTQLIPGWRERSPADLAVALSELVAYVADQLSYQQDAVATEAYLDTARLRTSLRRHALLVDYHLHDGCNARAWIHVIVKAGTVDLQASGTRFYTRLPGHPVVIEPDSRQDTEALQQRPTVFEPIHDSVLRRAHNRLLFYTWGEQRCCLPAGAIRATLSGHHAHLEAGDVLLFEEIAGPLTGVAADADPRHRHVVRLTSVTKFAPPDPADPGTQVKLTDPLTEQNITEIEWDEADALAFPLCISSITDEDHLSVPVEDVSVARGNMVLADHGHTMQPEPIGTVPYPRLDYPPEPGNHCSRPARKAVPANFSPRLGGLPITNTGTVKKVTISDGARTVEQLPFDPDRPAAEAMRWRMQDTLPTALLHDGNPERWRPVRNLLHSSAVDPHFVVEVEHDGTAGLRFGDDTFGRRPKPGAEFTATYRVGNGRSGNVGAEAIHHIVTNKSGLRVRNPLPAQGGTDPEDAASVRRAAPQAFRRLERAVTPADYAHITERAEGVQRAAATMRWTGSWHTVFVTVDRRGGVSMDDLFEQDLRLHVEPFRMAGHDVEFDDPDYVSLELDLLVCVKDGYLRSDVRAGLFQQLGSRALPGGGRGLFHPDLLSFGQTVYLGPVYAAARRVPGVESVEVTRFARRGVPDPTHLTHGYMRLNRLQVPRLDNDPSFVEHGLLRLELFGGK